MQPVRVIKDTDVNVLTGSTSVIKIRNKSFKELMNEEMSEIRRGVCCGAESSQDQ